MPTNTPTPLAYLNQGGHKRSLVILMVITLAHLAEHLFQMVQVFVLGWERAESLGALGFVWPQLVESEWMHFGYALVMFAGIVMLSEGFTGRSKRWWTIALWIQGWHLFEHTLLAAQAMIGQNLGGGPVPMSVIQFFAPRIELHMFYNTVVLVPMILAMIYHRWPSLADQQLAQCSCSAARRSLVEQAPRAH